MFKVNNKDIFVNFVHILHLVLVFPYFLLHSNKFV